MSDDIMIHRTAPSDNFTVLHNEIFELEGLSATALGLLTYLLSKPPNWKVSQAQLQKRFKVGRDKINSIMKELEGFGFIVKKQMRDPETQSFGKVQMHIYDRPTNPHQTASKKPSDEGDLNAELGDEIPFTENPLTGKPSTANPSTAEPSTAEPLTANPHLINKDNIINNNTNKSPQPPAQRKAAPKRRKGRRKAKGSEVVPVERQRVFVELGSPQWKAWVRHRGRKAPTSPHRETGKPGWYFDSEWPPGHSEHVPFTPPPTHEA